MSLDEKLRLAKTAAMKPEWQNARLAMVLALNTTMRACEIKSFRWYDVDFLSGTVTIRKSKTEAGQRMIPLNQDALSSMRELYGLASATGGTHPEHYLFPACENDHFDLAVPQKSWRSAWRSLRKAAGIASLRSHDLRHHAITELAESQASDATIMAIAGHVSRQMLEHYSHVCLDLKRKALDGLSTSRNNSGVSPHSGSKTGVGWSDPDASTARNQTTKKIKNNMSARAQVDDRLSKNGTRYRSAQHYPGTVQQRTAIRRKAKRPTYFLELPCHSVASRAPKFHS